MQPSESSFDVAIVGAGAAGLATAIFTARSNPALRIAALDGAKKIGAKILVSGGGRCNVTNQIVTTADFFGGNRNIVKKILAALPVERVVEFFRGIGVRLHEEPLGKLFPDTNDASTVATALIDEAQRRGVRLLTGHRVIGVERGPAGFRIDCGEKQLTARNVALATGGLSLPKTGSDGAGYGFAQSLGHSLVPTTPALAPLVLSGDFHAQLSGIAHDVELTIRAEGDKPVRMSGAMLWTHFGISGPVALDASRFWHRAKSEGRSVSLTANLLPGDDFAAVESRLLSLASSRPRGTLANALAERLPARVATALLMHLQINPQTPLAHLAREDRRKLITGLLAWPLSVRDSRGYAYAEVTAGGVPLEEIDPATMESRKCPGLYLVGEILDVDGRIGGFNFQWAWSTGFVAGRALAKNSTTA